MKSRTIIPFALFGSLGLVILFIIYMGNKNMDEIDKCREVGGLPLTAERGFFRYCLKKESIIDMERTD